MKPKVFKNRERVKEQLDLPGEYSYSFVGEADPEYHAKVEEIVVRVVGENNIRHRSFRSSSGGKYMAYKFEVFHMAFTEVEQVYEEVGGLDGTRFLI